MKVGKDMYGRDVCKNDYVLFIVYDNTLERAHIAYGKVIFGHPDRNELIILDARYREYDSRYDECCLVPPEHMPEGCF